MRVNQEFEDGDACKVYLKDPHAPIDSDEARERRKQMKLWYDRAFGVLRNIMKIKFVYRSPLPKPLQYEYFINISHKMFPEMVEEFSDQELHNYPSNDVLQLELNTEKSNIAEYLGEVDRPWGNFTPKLLFRSKDAKEGEDGYDLKPIPDEYMKDYFSFETEPEPVSLEKQK